ncbi:MAG: hypothetical protein KKF44_11315 [Nanoarchaeota archaeon]|nr:hypothetical protein [Nanoarchaeota archaeon]
MANKAFEEIISELEEICKDAYQVQIRIEPELEAYENLKEGINSLTTLTKTEVQDQYIEFIAKGKSKSAHRDYQLSSQWGYTVINVINFAYLLGREVGINYVDEIPEILPSKSKTKFSHAITQGMLILMKKPAELDVILGEDFDCPSLSMILKKTTDFYVSEYQREWPSTGKKYKQAIFDLMLPYLQKAYAIGKVSGMYYDKASKIKKAQN